MTFIEAVKELYKADFVGKSIESRPYMTRGKEHVTISGGHLYEVTTSEYEGRTNVLALPFSPHVVALLAENWEVVNGH